MTNPQVPNSVSTSNGTYYVGMTKAQAEKQKIYSCFIGVDFKDLDTDNIGSKRNIARYKEASRSRQVAKWHIINFTLWCWSFIISSWYF